MTSSWPHKKSVAEHGRELIRPVPQPLSYALLPPRALCFFNCCKSRRRNMPAWCSLPQWMEDSLIYGSSSSFCIWMTAKFPLLPGHWSWLVCERVRLASRDAAAAAAACRAVTLTQASYLHWLDELKSKPASKRDRKRERQRGEEKERTPHRQRLLPLFFFFLRKDFAS